jgi:hypothetical protein
MNQVFINISLPKNIGLRNIYGYKFFRTQARPSEGARLGVEVCEA